jgi:hypothetical protein
LKVLLDPSKGKLDFGEMWNSVGCSIFNEKGKGIDPESGKGREKKIVRRSSISPLSLLKVLLDPSKGKSDFGEMRNSVGCSIFNEKGMEFDQEREGHRVNSFLSREAVLFNISSIHIYLFL